MKNMGHLLKENRTMNLHNLAQQAMVEASENCIPTFTYAS